MAKSPQPSPSSQPHGRGHSRFRRTEAARLVKAAHDNGLVVTGIEAVGNNLRVLTREPGEPGGSSNPWDEVLTDAADKKRRA